MGDFNLPHINWTTRQSQAPSSKLIYLMNTNSMQQHVNEPTRGNNILDLVMTTTDLSINSLEVTGKIGDHQMIDFSLEAQDLNTRTQHKQVLDYKRANFELMKEELGSYNYEVLMNNKNAEECYMILKDKIATATDHHIPRKRIRPTNNPPWFSHEIKHLINARQHSHRRLKRYQTEPHRQEHMHACRAVKRTIKSTKQNKEITVTAQAKTNPKSFCKYVNDRRLKRDTIGPLIDSEGSTQTNNKSNAKILNTYFTPVFTHEDLTEIPQPHVLNTQEILSDGVFTVDEVEEQLSIINPYKSTGPDGLGQRILKETAEGFREKRSCLTNLLDFFGEVNRIYDRTKAVDLVYLDFQKAFDKVPHERLMAKVEVHGIRGNYSRWIRNWLTGRTQRVVIHDETSDPALVTSGVPQGSVLGPLLFIIYINDLDVGIISKINKFADDTKLCHRAFTERDRETIQSDLNRLLQWTETWQMSFNIEKCSEMHVGANNRHFQQTMYNIPIETVQQQRDLGVIVTENLKHDKQVEKSVKNASRILGFIARNFEYKLMNMILPLYKALVRPHLEYAVQLWSPT
ncbi:Endonuclease/exonuclease/phosphatase [Trinorchestia longiramus]|nr:Endonuclease/exonuclease/phosphatase [Trinorchestia longiramus]